MPHVQSCTLAAVFDSAGAVARRASARPMAMPASVQAIASTITITARTAPRPSFPRRSFPRRSFMERLLSSSERFEVHAHQRLEAHEALLARYARLDDG